MGTSIDALAVFTGLGLDDPGLRSALDEALRAAGFAICDAAEQAVLELALSREPRCLILHPRRARASRGGLHAYDVLRALAPRLSSRLGPAVQAMVFDSDDLLVFLYERGEQLDCFGQAADAFPEDVGRVSKRPGDAWSRVAPAGDLQPLTQALGRRSAFQEERLAAFASALGAPGLARGVDEPPPAGVPVATLRLRRLAAGELPFPDLQVQVAEERVRPPARSWRQSFRPLGSTAPQLGNPQLQLPPSAEGELPLRIENRGASGRGAKLIIRGARQEDPLLEVVAAEAQGSRASFEWRGGFLEATLPALELPRGAEVLVNVALRSRNRAGVAAVELIELVPLEAPSRPVKLRITLHVEAEVRKGFAFARDETARKFALQLSQPAPAAGLAVLRRVPAAELAAVLQAWLVERVGGGRMQLQIQYDGAKTRCTAKKLAEKLAPLIGASERTFRPVVVGCARGGARFEPKSSYAKEPPAPQLHLGCGGELSLEQSGIPAAFDALATQGLLLSAECAPRRFGGGGDLMRVAYELACGVDDPRSTTLPWALQHVRGVSEQMWLAPELAQRVDAGRLAALAELAPLGACVRLTLRPGIPLEALEEVLAPILPGAAGRA